MTTTTTTTASPTNSYYSYDQQLVNDFLALAFQHNGKIYGGFVRDFVARDYIREHGAGPRVGSVEYTWKVEDRHCQPIPAASHSLHGDADSLHYFVKQLKKDTKYQLTADKITFEIERERSRVKDIDLLFSSTDDRKAFIADVKVLTNGSFRTYDVEGDMVKIYPFDVIPCSCVNMDGRIVPSCDLTVADFYPVDDSPVNLLTYDGKSLAVNAPVDSVNEAPSLSTVLGMIDR